MSKSIKHAFVTYNVLSSKLCTAKQMPLCTVDACDPKQRLERVLAKLTRDACSQRAVISLQEVIYTLSRK